MLAAIVPSVNGKWEVKEVSTPQAGTNQVLIKIHASGICYTDVHITKGHAEYMVAYADATQLIPTGLSYDQAAPIFCAGYTVYSGLIQSHMNVLLWLV
jgi:D-arabinose 1-dehydrogenase-like Zn-dependent alcohol dehydrogenase